MVKIGYQGIKNSYSHMAAVRFAEMMDFGADLVGLMTSRKVVEALLRGDIDYGVVALRNSIAGEVVETSEALDGIEHTIVSEIDLKIHHCLFGVRGVERKNIRRVASHEQALAQTRKYFAKNFDEVEKIVVEDTSLAAVMLAAGGISSDTGVVCSKDAGMTNGLELIDENIEDREDNKTTFGLVRVRGE